MVFISILFFLFFSLSADSGSESGHARKNRDGPKPPASLQTVRLVDREVMKMQDRLVFSENVPVSSVVIYKVKIMLDVAWHFCGCVMSFRGKTTSSLALEGSMPSSVQWHNMSELLSKRATTVKNCVLYCIEWSMTLIIDFVFRCSSCVRKIATSSTKGSSSTSTTKAGPRSVQLCLCLDSLDVHCTFSSPLQMPVQPLLNEKLLSQRCKLA